MLELIREWHTRIQEVQPLVLCLTNYVTMDLMANSLLAVGAAPIMSESLAELEELINISHSVYINIGTLNDAFIERAQCAATLANALNKPLILDPVGAGASVIRTATATDLMKKAQIIRGNASELLVLAGSEAQTKGVESLDEVETAHAPVKLLAKALNKVCVVSGVNDYVTDGVSDAILPFGSPMMPRITGMGCTMTAILAAFAAVDADFMEAAICATAFFGLCGQSVQESTHVPGTFRTEFLNRLFKPDWDYCAQACNHLEFVHGI